MSEKRITNAEKYKTAGERAEAFVKFCESHDCYELTTCPIGGKESDRRQEKHTCLAYWLELEAEAEAEAEKPLPCPFCGGEAVATTNIGGLSFVVCDCGYSSEDNDNKAKAIAAHNRVARAVAAAKAKEANDAN